MMNGDETTAELEKIVSRIDELRIKMAGLWGKSHDTNQEIIDYTFSH